MKQFTKEDLYKKIMALFGIPPEDDNISPPVQTILDRMESGDISINKETPTLHPSYTNIRIVLSDEGVGEVYEVVEMLRSGRKRGKGLPTYSSTPTFFTQEECEALYSTAEAILIEEWEEFLASGKIEEDIKNAKERALLVGKYNVLGEQEK